MYDQKEKRFQLFNGILLIFISITMILPMIHLLAVSLSASKYASAKLVGLWPKGFNFEVYEMIIGMRNIWQALGVSVYITIVGTLICLLLTTSLSYTLSRPFMPGKKLWLNLILLTFILPSPLIPTYMLVDSLGMIDSLWSLIIPAALGAWYVFITKTFFQNIPGELFDSAKMDGCNELSIYFRIVLPLSKPVIATIALFHAVAQWNGYFQALIFLRSKELYPVQLLLRNLVFDGDAANDIGGNLQLAATPEQISAGIIMFTTIPILLVYPFLQKHFVKGAMLGSLKE